MNNLIAYLKNLIAKRFFGRVIITFQEGKITNFEIRKTEDVTLFN